MYITQTTQTHTHIYYSICSLFLPFGVRLVSYHAGGDRCFSYGSGGFGKGGPTGGVGGRRHRLDHEHRTAQPAPGPLRDPTARHPRLRADPFLRGILHCLYLVLKSLTDISMTPEVVRGKYYFFESRENPPTRGGIPSLGNKTQLAMQRDFTLCPYIILFSSFTFFFCFWAPGPHLKEALHQKMIGVLRTSLWGRLSMRNTNLTLPRPLLSLQNSLRKEAGPRLSDRCRHCGLYREVHRIN